MAKPADRSGASAVLPYLYQLVPGLPRLGTSIGREERRRGTNSLELQNANFFCSLLPRVSCRRCKVQLLHLVLQDAKTSPECQNLSGAFAPGDPGCELPAPGATRGDECTGDPSLPSADSWGGGRGCWLCPWHLWQRTRTAFCLMQDLGALSRALGLRGALAGFGAGRGCSRSPAPPTRPAA